MSALDAQRCLDRASVHVCRGDDTDALLWLDRAQKLGGETGREQLLRGLALAKAGRREEALESLRRSTMLDPTEPRAFYNYACMLLRAGDPALAKEIALEALRLRPKYKEAQQLLEVVNGKGADAPFDPGEPHTIGWIIDAGPSWTYIGWAIVAFASAMIVISRFVRPIGSADLLAKNIDIQLFRDPASIVIGFLTIVSILCSFAWVITDLIDRRGRAIWLVPMIVGTFCIWGGLTAVAHGLYMLIGRK